MTMVRFWTWIALLFFAETVKATRKDWLLVENAGIPSSVLQVCWQDGLCGLELSNGLLTRRFTLQPGFGTVDFLEKDKSMLRAIEPEATLVLNSSLFQIGDLVSADTFRAYLNRTSLKTSLRAVPSSRNNVTFRYLSHRITTPKAPFDWTPGARHSLHANWPPKGVTLEVIFGLNITVDAPFSSLQATLYYELYDGIPVMAKWMTLEYNSSKADNNNVVHVESVTVEQLASSPPYGAYISHGSSAPYDLYNGAATSAAKPPPLLVALTDQAHGARCDWIDDYLTSNDTGTSPSTPHDMGASEPLLMCSYTHEPGVYLGAESPKPSLPPFESYSWPPTRQI
jgi:hypothetical protein